MKIIDRYILTSYLKTFISVFLILMFIFILQTIWLYISELAGRDLDFSIILRFLLYFTPNLIPLVLPLTILVSSIMVFGNFAEKYEFAAMKSTGISLQRAMRSTLVFIIILSGITFYFANEVIPWSEYKSHNLRRNIAQLQPAVAIQEGRFSQIGDITIKVDSKSGERNQFLHNVVIHKKNPTRKGNFTVINATSGELTSEENSNTLSLTLFDGNYYDEILTNNISRISRRPFAKSYFETYVINIDLSSINAIDLSEDQGISNEKMFRISELKLEIDSLVNTYNIEQKRFPEDVIIRSGFTSLALGLDEKTTTKPPDQDNTILSLYTNPIEKTQILELAKSNLLIAKQIIESRTTHLQNKTRELNKYEMALHNKYVLAIACIILFFVGAPLGAIIRKGGMGLPMVVAIAIFLSYHFLGIFAKNSAENGKLAPFLGAWLSTFIMLPIGIWLTHKATTDQELFSFESVSKFFKKLKLKNFSK